MTALNDKAAFRVVSGLWRGEREPYRRTRVLRSTDFRGDTRLDYSDVAEVDASAKQSLERQLKRGDIIVERSGGGPKQPVGRVARFDLESDSYCAGNFTSVIRVIDRNRFDPEFLCLYLHHLYLRGETESLQRATTGIRNLAWAEYLQFSVPARPLSEQKAIAKALSAAQRAYLIEEKCVASAAELKRATMHELFTLGLSESARDWTQHRLGTLFRLKHGYAFEGKFFGAVGTHVLLTPGHFLEGGGFRDQGDKTRYYTGPVPDGFVLSPGELLVAMTEQKPGLLGSAVFVPTGSTFLHNQRLGLVANLDRSKLDAGFLFHLMATSQVRSEIASTASGSKVRHTSPDRIGNITVALPSLNEQSGITVILDTIDRKIDLHKRKRDVLDQLFQALLHKLMTGEIRVSDLNLSALETPVVEAGAQP